MASMFGLMMLAATPAAAQVGPGAALPPVNVDPPARRPRPAKPQPSVRAPQPVRARASRPTSRPRSIARTPAAQPSAAPNPASVPASGAPETATGPVNGYVARRSATGTKTDTPLLETPQSVSVISQDQIRAQQATTLGETLRYTPGVVAEEYGGTDLRIDQYMIRGFSSSMPFIDGLTTNGRYTLLSTSVDPYGVERVSILRGPSSVLYGQNVPGGIVDIVSKRPLDTPFHEVELQGGSFGRYQGAFDLSGPATPDGTVLYRLVGLGRGGGTQVDHVDTSRLYLAPSFTWKPDADTTITLLSHVQHSDDGFAFQNLPTEGVLYRSPTFGRIPTSLFVGEPAFNTLRRDEYAIGYSAEHRFNDNFLVRQNLRYSYLDTSIALIGGSGLEPGTSTIDRFALGAKAHQESFAVDTQGQLTFDTWALQHMALVGVDYFRAHDQWVERDGDASPLNLVWPVYGQPFTQPAPDFATSDTLSQVGIYAQDQIRWNHFTLTGGLRQDWADTTVRDLIASSVVPQHDKALTGRIGLTYQFEGGLAPYVSYATYFLPTVGSSFDGTPFKPSTGDQIEGGIKYQPTGFNSFIMLSGFNLNQSNVLTTDPEHIFFQVQTGAIRVRGFEASAVADLDDGWKAVAAYTYLDAAITRDNDGFVGNRPLDVPRHMASLWLDKTFIGGPLAGFGIGGGVRYVGQRFGDNGNTLSIPGNVLYDLAVHYKYQGWRAAINIKNLLNERYVATCGSESFCYYGQRRTVMATLSYRW